jgi:hypothetical protein
MLAQVLYAGNYVDLAKEIDPNIDTSRFPSKWTVRVFFSFFVRYDSSFQ